MPVSPNYVLQYRNLGKLDADDGDDLGLFSLLGIVG